MTSAVLERLAVRIREAYERRVPTPPVRDELQPGDVASAYAIQKINTEHWLRQGRRLVGRKIGLTSVAVQKQLGVEQPDYGMLYADMAMYDGEELPVSKLMQPKVEAEVALVLERDLDRPGIQTAELISAVAYALPAIEIVGSRIEKWNIEIQDTIADNASSGMFVLGNEPKKLDGLDLRLCGMVMESAATRFPSAQVQRAWAIRSTRRCGSPAPWSKSARRSRPAISS